MEKITYETMQNFILEKELTDSVALSLHPDSFDDLVMDYLDFNNNQIERPFEILGIEIMQDSTGAVAKNNVQILTVVA
jgi:hypothetical protein